MGELVFQPFGIRPPKGSGLVFHNRSDELVGYCHDFEERMKHLWDWLDKDEILHLYLFRPIPEDRLPRKGEEGQRAYKAYEEARAAYNEAVIACDRAFKAVEEVKRGYIEAHKLEPRAPEKRVWEEAYNAALKAADELFDDKVQEAERRLEEAVECYVKVNWEAFQKLHEELCFDYCPWDGKTIFSRRYPEAEARLLQDCLGYQENL